MKYTKEQCEEKIAHHKEKVKVWEKRLEKIKTVKVGFWYRYNNGLMDKDSILFVTRIEGYKVYFYGMDSEDGWVKDWYHLDNEWSLATNEDVENALKKEAKKRGFKEGVYIKNDLLVTDRLNQVISEYDYNNIDFEIDHKNSLNYGTNTIFLEGKWAEIVEPKYEYQFLYKDSYPEVKASKHFYISKEDFNNKNLGCNAIKEIVETKRLIK